MNEPAGTIKKKKRKIGKRERSAQGKNVGEKKFFFLLATVSYSVNLSYAAIQVKFQIRHLSCIHGR